MLDNIDIKIEKLEGSKERMNVKIKFNDFLPTVKSVGRELSNEIKVDGFRKGKAPYEAVERIVGREKILNEGAEKMAKKIFMEMVVEKDLQVIGRPEINFKKLVWGNDFEFEVVYFVLPKVELSAWEDEIGEINKKFRENKYETKEEEIKRELDFLAGQRAKIITVNREARKDDQVMVDFEVQQAGVVIEGGTARNHPVIIGKGGFIPGFEEQIEGMTAGQEKKFKLKFPKEYHQKFLAGKEAEFKVKVNLVQERQTPEINDEFASGIGKFKNLSELKENLSKGIALESKNKNEKDWQGEILKKMIEKIENFENKDIPEILIVGEVERMMQELEQSVGGLGLDLKSYFDQIKTTKDNIEKQWKEKEAPERIKAHLVMNKIINDKKIEPSKEEIEEKMNQILQYYKTIGDLEKKIDMDRLYEKVKGDIANQKALEYLKSL